MDPETRESTLIGRVSIGGSGLSLVVIGVVALFREGFYSTLYARYISFGEHPQVIGVLLILAGVAMIAVSLKRRSVDGGDQASGR